MIGNDPAIRGLLAPAFHVWLIGRAGLHRFPGARLSPIAFRTSDSAA